MGSRSVTQRRRQLDQIRTLAGYIEFTTGPCRCGRDYIEQALYQEARVVDPACEYHRAQPMLLAAELVGVGKP
jgi:hypothetical protein